MKTYIEYILFAMLFLAATVTFMWLLLSVFAAMMGGQS